MIKHILHTVFFISACSVIAQTNAPADTLKPSVKPIQADTAAAQITPAAPAIQPASVTTQTLHPTAPNIKHRKKPSEAFEKENKEITALYREPFDKKKEIVLQNKRYRIYNNYLTAGVGKCYNSGWKEWELNTAVDYHFHVQKNRFQIGALLTGPNFRDNNCVQLHIGWGYRLERCNYHWAAYGGISYSDGYRLQQGYLQNPDTVYKTKLSTIGVYANLQFYYKLKFDYGIGASAFIDANNTQVLTGIRVELFFSGAYKGFKKINYAKEEEKY